VSHRRTHMLLQDTMEAIRVNYPRINARACSCALPQFTASRNCLGALASTRTALGWLTTAFQQRQTRLLERMFLNVEYFTLTTFSVNNLIYSVLKEHGVFKPFAPYGVPYTSRYYIMALSICQVRKGGSGFLSRINAGVSAANCL
jgi:hypothetical protein